MSYLSKIQKYITKYKIFRPQLKKYLKKTGYIRGYVKIIKTAIIGGLRIVYHQLMAYENEYVYTLPQDIQSCRYVIYAPDFVSNSAGIFCLYKLCHDLRQKGLIAAIYGSVFTPKTLNAPLISEKCIKQLQNKEDIWVVYPETIPGNPLNIKNVARWVLNKPGFLGGDEKYPDSEKVFVYSNVYLPYVKNTVHGKLYMPTFDSSIFYPPKDEDLHEKRSLACYYVGKSTFKEGHFDSDETFEITRTHPPKSELGKLFRSAKVLYTFDNSTALTYEAIACGCPVQIIPDGSQTWEDYEKLEWGTMGIFWDKPAVNLTPDDVKRLLNKIKLTEDQYQLDLDNFINQTIGKTECLNK